MRNMNCHLFASTNLEKCIMNKLSIIFPFGKFCSATFAMSWLMVEQTIIKREAGENPALCP
jgi:hypothetical protein